MRVLYIHQHFSTPKGSAGTRSYEFARALIAKGHQITMVCGSNQLSHTGLNTEVKRGIRRGEVEGIQVIEIVIPYSNHDGFVKRALKFLQFSWRCTRLVFQEKYDLLFATSTPLTVAIPGIVLKFFKPKKRFIFEVRDLWPELPKAMKVITNPVILKLMAILEKKAYLAANALIGLSPGIVSGIKKIVPNKPVGLIPNGCDREFFQQVPKQREIFEKFGLSQNEFIAVFTGAHGIANGLDAVLDAAELLQKQGNKKIKFLFVGDGKLKPVLMARAEQQSLDNCVFIDPMPKSELRQVLRSADVGLMVLQNIPAFYFGTSPNKFFDYLSSELPVLTNYPGWVSELIQENNCGLTVSPDDPEGFADALVKISRFSREKLAKLSVNAGELAKLQFDRVKLSGKFIGVCEKVCGISNQDYEEMLSDETPL